jgi:hypothetical protein
LPILHAYEKSMNRYVLMIEDERMQDRRDIMKIKKSDTWIREYRTSNFTVLVSRYSLFYV